jgi:molecular chaperone GrpE
MSEENEYATDPAAPTAADDATTATAGRGADGTGAEGADAGEDTVSRDLTEQRDKYLRLAAEYDNFRRRTMKERQEAHARGQADLIRGLIDTLDDLGRVAHVDPDTTDTRTVVDGVSMVERKLLKTLTNAGLQVIDPTGQPFDPATMEAVMTEPADSPEEDHKVARVFQLGYVFNGQLLRPARVVVKQWNG